ncbi:MAG: TIGR00282 family metallophosphoesterase [Patescibacteria group bacterium]|jgi:hypothetical protein
MKILFIGDIVGFIGRETIKKILPKLKKKYNPDLIIANAENLAHGKGASINTLTEMKEAGIDYFTSGNHIFSRKGFADFLDDDGLNILRPANYPDNLPGTGEKVINISPPRLGRGEAGQKKVLLVNLIGRVFMREDFDCPFKKFNEIIKKYKTKKIDAVIIDFHAEATSEKKAFGFYADGKAAAILGTHTHIQTSDEQILPLGTAYITDVGATAAHNSVLGVDKKIVISSFLDQINYTHDFPRSGQCEFNAVLVDVDLKNKISKNIKRIREIINI